MDAHLKCAVDAVARARLAVDRTIAVGRVPDSPAVALRALLAASYALRAADFLVHDALSQYQGSIAQKAKVEEQ